MKYARYALITLSISLLPSVVLAVGSNFPDSYFAKDNPTTHATGKGFN
jgi:hypothetical protein